MKIWAFIQQKLEETIPVMLLCVVYSKGSSPGRQGFKMVVAKDGEINGTIGGGIMEHKLVEKSKSLLAKLETNTFLLPQYHDKQHSNERSGMICSGEQTIAFVPIYSKYSFLIEDIVSNLKNGEFVNLKISSKGISTFQKNPKIKETHNFITSSKKDWEYVETIGKQSVIHIFGGGHVGLALSEVMNFLGFYVHIYDNREELNTLEQNHFADVHHIVQYDQILTKINLSEEDYVAIMTFGYRDDKIILKQLLKQNLQYLGLMGSKAKIAALLEELKMEGFSKEDYATIFSPIGLDISSKTSREIAISVAAEIIKVKNSKE